MGGLVIVDKPSEWTSHDVVAKMRRIAGTKKVGHAGTLDPMATGVLILGVGRATRLLGHLAATDKTYETTIRLGATTSTDDADGEVTASTPADQLDDDAIAAACARFVGDIEQIPSSVSAIKVDGKRAYARVRAGETVQLSARPVTVSALELLGVNRPGDGAVDVQARVHCSTGTYIRALARDVGAVLGVGGHLRALRRTRVGAFTLDQARTLDEVASASDPLTVTLSDAARASFPVRHLDAEETDALAHGRRIDPGGVPGIYAAFDPAGELIALAHDDVDRTRSDVVFRSG